MNIVPSTPRLIDLHFYVIQFQTNATPSVRISIADLDDVTKLSVGRYVMLNQDHDEDNRDADGNPLDDNEPDATRGENIALTDIDLLNGQIDVAKGLVGSLSITSPSNVKLWRYESLTGGNGPSNVTQILSGVPIAVDSAAAAQVIKLKIEGTGISAAKNDVLLNATFTPSAGAAVSDSARMTVAAVDVDVDSDNDEGFGTDVEGDKDEGVIEQRADLPGKYAEIDERDGDADGVPAYLDYSAQPDNRFVPMELTLSGKLDMTNARLKFVYAGATPGASVPADAHLRIWRKAATQNRDATSAATGGDFVPVGSIDDDSYLNSLLPSDLGLSESQRKVVLWVEGVRTTTLDAQRLIQLKVDADGIDGPDSFHLYDSTRVTVVPFGQGAVVVDNDGSDGRFTTTGTWANNTSDGAARNKNQVVASAGGGTNVATWTFDDLVAGTYQVATTWLNRTGAATNAPFAVFDDQAQRLSTTVDQTAAPSGLGGADVNDRVDASVWTVLSNTVNVTSGTLRVQLTNAGADGNVYADAIRIIRTGDATGNLPPTIDEEATVIADPADNTKVLLSVLGDDDGEEPNLTYTWSVVNPPTGTLPTFGAANGTNAGKSLSVTLDKADTYTFRVTITDAGGLTVADDADAITIAQVLTFVQVQPQGSTVGNGQTQLFTAVANDQFGDAMATQPTLTWSLDTDADAVDGNVTPDANGGLYAAPTQGTGTDVARATDTASTLSGTSTVAVSGGSVLPTITIDAPDAVATEAGPTTATFTITRTGTVGDLEVFYELDDIVTSAEIGDYQALASSVFILDGEASATITVTPSQDGDDDNETLSLKLVPDTAYAIGTMSEDEITIVDDDGTQTATIDLDIFEDTDHDGLHDNSTIAEQAETSNVTYLPMFDDGQTQRMALVLVDVTPNDTIKFLFDSAEYRLFWDVASSQEIPANTPILVSSITTLIGGGATVQLFGAVDGEGPTGSGLSLVLGQAAAVGVLMGGVAGGMENDDDWYDGNPDNDNDDENDNDGGLDDGDGNQPLTDRDGWWDEPVKEGSTAKNKDGGFLIIGFAGHSQSKGFDTVKGRIWNIEKTTGTYEIGLKLQNKGYPVTLFPEDPGNQELIEAGPEGLQLCGDGVLGAVNSHKGNQRVNSDDNPIRSGALAFLVDAIKGNAAENRPGKTKIGLFGYSHGGGSLELLIQALANEAENDPVLKPLISNTPGTPAPPVTFFWTADIDAVDIRFNPGSGDSDASGWPDGEDNFPLARVDNEQTGPVIGTMRHFNIYQQGDMVAGGDGDGDGVNLSGNDLAQGDGNGITFAS